MIDNWFDCVFPFKPLIEQQEVSWNKGATMILPMTQYNVKPNPRSQTSEGMHQKVFGSKRIRLLLLSKLIVLTLLLFTYQQSLPIQSLHIYLSAYQSWSKLNAGVYAFIFDQENNIRVQLGFERRGGKLVIKHVVFSMEKPMILSHKGIDIESDSLWLITSNKSNNKLWNTSIRESFTTLCVVN